MSTPRKKPTCSNAGAWLKVHKGEDYFAPMTREDRIAFSIFVHAAQLLQLCWSKDRELAILAMRSAVLAMQPSVRHVARDALPSVLDWKHVAEAWRALGTDTPLVDPDSPTEHRTRLGLSSSGP